MFHLRVDDDTDLRLLVETQAESLFALIEANRQALRRWLPWVVDIRSLADSRRFIRFGLRQHISGNGMQAGVWHQSRLAGVVSYNHIDHIGQRTEIGYWLDTAFQGQGIMTATCRAMTSYAFETLGLEYVEIRCALANDRSRAIPQRLGYTTDGIVPQLDWASDRYVDTVIYCMSAIDWRGNHEIA